MGENMNKNDIASINWEVLWAKKLEHAEHTKRQAVNWDDWAAIFEKQFSQSDYRDRLIEKMNIRPEASILDVGCGPGTLALPLAPLVSSITALDISAGMLRVGADRAREKNIKNITFKQLNWDDVVVGRDILPHDIVVCSRAFTGRKPRESLLKLNEAAKKYVYLTLRTDGDGAQTFYNEIYHLLGKEYLTPPDYIYCYNMLYQSGILACVDFICYTDSFRYDKEEDAFRVLNTHVQADNPEQEEKLMSYIRKNIRDNQGFKLDIKSRWALLSWQKEEVNRSGSFKEDTVQ
jgi:SAM-dependent methyltransferase